VIRQQVVPTDGSGASARVKKKGSPAMSKKLKGQVAIEVRMRVLAVMLHARDAKALVVPEPAKEKK
jgi:hypothetical protein